MNTKYSIVIPAYNEEGGIGSVIAQVLRLGTAAQFEVIVIDDHSSDGTAGEVRNYPVRLLTNVQNFGYGYSLKRGIRAASHEHIIILDGDGSYPVSAIPTLLEEYEKGFDMVVGIRQGNFYRGSRVKRVGRFAFRVLSEFATGRRIPDINSGMRIFRKDLALAFFHTLSSGFSFTTTITLAFMLNAYSVRYIPIEYHKRKGTSKVRYLRDTLRASQIIVESIVFYNPLKIFLLCSIGVFLVGLVSMIVGFFSVGLGLLLFFTFAGALQMLALGFIAIFLKYMYNGAHPGPDPFSQKLPLPKNRTPHQP